MDNNRNIKSRYDYIIVILLIAFISINTTQAQVAIGIDQPSPSAMLHVSATSDGGLTYKGLIPPRIPTILNRDAMSLSSSDIGMVIFVSETGCLQIFNGINWESINCLTLGLNSSVDYTSTLQSVNEGDGGIDLPFTITNPSGINAITLTITPNTYDEIDETTPQNVVIPSGNSTWNALNVFTLTDDTDIEGLHQTTFTITAISGGSGIPTIGTFDDHVVNITDNDFLFTPFVESFETNGNGTRYTLSAPEVIDPPIQGDDYFSRGQNSDFTYPGNNSVDLFGTPDGSFFFAAQDIDDVTGITDSQQTIQFTGIAISSGINLELDILLAEDDDGSDEDWDAPNDSLIIEYQIDGGGYQNLLSIESELPTGSNGEPKVDLDFNGVGEGAIVTSSWNNFNAAIAGTGTVLDLRITFNLNSDDEDIAIDYIRITSN